MEDNPLQYAHPPVSEAIFSVAFQEGLALASIRAFCDLEWTKANYPVVIELNDTAGEQSNSTTEPLGFGLRATDGKTLLRFTTTQFSFHNLNTYLGWEANQVAFLTAWQHVGSCCQPPIMEYASIRYINKINLGPVPTTGIELGRYLKLLPDLPPDFPGEPGQFFLQVESIDEAAQLEAVVWQTVLGGDEIQPFYVMLDISVRSSTGQAPPQLTEFLSQGRIFKNRMFESCITPLTRTLFN